MAHIGSGPPGCGEKNEGSHDSVPMAEKKVARSTSRGARCAGGIKVRSRSKFVGETREDARARTGQSQRNPGPALRKTGTCTGGINGGAGRAPSVYVIRREVAGCNIEGPSGSPMSCRVRNENFFKKI